MSLLLPRLPCLLPVLTCPLRSKSVVQRRECQHLLLNSKTGRVCDGGDYDAAM